MKDTVDPAEKKGPTDKELVAAAQKGDESSFGQLLQRYQTSLFSMVFRNLGHREEAEDVVQQVFMKAYQHIDHFRGESKFYTWLYSIALNQIRNHIRQRYTRRTVSLDNMGPNDQGPAPQWAENGPTPEEQVLSLTDIEAIQASLADLGEDQRNIFVWHYFQQQSLGEVAARLGRPLGTVKVYLHRARKAIYKSISDNEKKGRLKGIFPPDSRRVSEKAV